MREEHPIDERFKALYDAELSPPQEVREALAQHMGWDTASAAGSWRNWLSLLAGAMLAVTSATYIVQHEGTSAQLDSELAADPAERTASVNGSPAIANAPVATHLDQQLSTQPERSTNPSTVDPQPAHALSHTAGPTDASSAAPTSATEDPAGTPSAMPTKTTTQAAQRTSPATAKERSNTGSSHRGTLTAHSTTSEVNPTAQDGTPAQPNAAAAGTYGTSTTPLITRDVLLAENAKWMPLLPVGERSVASGQPIAGPHPSPYVLPAAQWWVGAYAGMGRLSGEWRGADHETMNAAEAWRGSSQWGLLFGRRWRSGWSVSAGVGLGLTRSTFNHDEQVWDQFMDVDTNWTETYYNNTSNVVYTWNIDTVSTLRPGATHNTHARNLYGALQVPLTVAWHGDIRRWHYGAFGGATVLIPTQREGNTLLREAGDAAPTVVSLGDARLNTRFGPRLNAHAGLSIGFAMTEALSVYAEPMFSIPVSTFGKGEAPWMRGHFLQLRLQHEFGYSTR